jgi:SAM-dependent methyltransferase
VHGLDIVDEIGAHAQGAERIYFHKPSIEDSRLPPNHFDLVFSHATMEHVGDVKAGFAEMARVTRPGGAIYSLAHPLWRSPYGHHMACFHGHPWVHLLFDSDKEIVTYARAHGIDGERGHSLEAIVAYMMDRRFFNQLPGSAYVQACAALSRTTIMSNALALELDAKAALAHPNGRTLLARGLRKRELLESSHLLQARRY